MAGHRQLTVLSNHCFHTPGSPHPQAELSAAGTPAQLCAALGVALRVSVARRAGNVPGGSVTCTIVRHAGRYPCKPGGDMATWPASEAGIP